MLAKPSQVVPIQGPRFVELIRKVAQGDDPAPAELTEEERAAYVAVCALRRSYDELFSTLQNWPPKNVTVQEVVLREPAPANTTQSVAVVDQIEALGLNYTAGHAVRLLVDATHNPGIAPAALEEVQQLVSCLQKRQRRSERR